MAFPFRIATFNLENLDWSAGNRGGFERRIAALRPMLAGLRADVLCLQEVNAERLTAAGPRRFAALQALLDGTEYSGFVQAATTPYGAAGPADVHNLVTSSRFPIAEQRVIFHDIVPAWRWTPPATGGGTLPSVEIAWERPLLYTRLAPPGAAPLHVLNLHLRAPRAAHIEGAKDRAVWRSTAAWAEGFFVAAQKRAGQALEARLLVERLFDADAAAEIAVCGDFNADEHEMPTRLLLADAADAGDRAPPGRSLVALEQRVAEDRRYSVIHAGRRVMLDHILASRALAARCSAVEVVNSGLADEMQLSEPPPGSLHAPLVAIFDAAKAS